MRKSLASSFICPYHAAMLNDRLEIRITKKQRKRWELAASMEEYDDVSSWMRDKLDGAATVQIATDRLYNKQFKPVDASRLTDAH